MGGAQQRGELGAFKADGTVVPNGWNREPAPIVEPLVTYWLATHDPDGLSFAKAYADHPRFLDAVRRGDVRHTVRTALKVLPEEQRRAVVLASVYGRTALEISESEGIPLGTAKTRIRTALIHGSTSDGS